MLIRSNFVKGCSVFTNDLLALEAASSVQHQLPYEAFISSPLRPKAWKNALSSIPDNAFTQFILRGISQGFRISVQEGHAFKPSRRNLKSAYNHPEVVTNYLQKEETPGQLVQLPSMLALTPLLVQISPFGVMPKKNKPNKCRLIVDLSSPEGQSINDAISRELCAVSMFMARGLGKGSFLAKLDLREAYRAVPFNPSDQRLLPVSWRGTTLIDKALPFGLRSAPKLFSALTDVMMWCPHKRGLQMALHYLDDFLLLGPQGYPQCERSLALTMALCEELGFSVGSEKQRAPPPLSHSRALR